MINVTATIYCETCETLHDVVVFWDFYFKPKREVPPRCEKRKRPPIMLWNRKQPCPRCDQALLGEDPRGHWF